MTFDHVREIFLYRVEKVITKNLVNKRGRHKNGHKNSLLSVNETERFHVGKYINNFAKRRAKT